MHNPVASVLEPQEHIANGISSPDAPNWRGPLFVIGMWRSGTSLLYALLNKHPEIALMYEADLTVLRPLFWLPGTRSGFIRRWEFWNRGLSRHEIDATHLDGEASLFNAAARNIYGEFARQKHALLGGEKSPNYFDSLTRLAQDFPEARFIVIWRDPASVCRSVIRAAGETHSWFDRRGMPLRVLMGMAAMRAQCDRLQERELPLFELRFNQLIDNPEQTMRAICEFLGVPFRPGMASLEGANRSAIYKGAHHELVNGDRIISSTQRAEVLPAKLKAKIQRYLALWHKRDPKSWPAPLENAATPSASERVLDAIHYRSLRLFDALVMWMYCFAPLSLLRRFREFKYKKEEARKQRPLP